jgi:predicted SnoaL-like aldol condensation-catalyzing enzyme
MVCDIEQRLDGFRPPNGSDWRLRARCGRLFMVTASRSSLRLLSIVIGLLFTGAVYYTMHYNPRWDWTAPGVGKLPQEIVHDFMDQAYTKGHGSSAAKSYFAKDAIDNVPDAQDRRDGTPLPNEVREIIAQGLTVAVLHRIGASRGEPSVDVIDVFRTKNGRIVRRDRYLTKFAQ